VKEYYSNTNDRIYVTTAHPEHFMKGNFPSMQFGQDWHHHGSNLELMKVGIKKHSNYFPGTDLDSWGHELAVEKTSATSPESVPDDLKKRLSDAIQGSIDKNHEFIPDDLKKRLSDAIQESINKKYESEAKKFVEACISFYSDPQHIDKPFKFVVSNAHARLIKYISDNYQITCTLDGNSISTSVSDIKLL